MKKTLAMILVLVMTLSGISAAAENTRNSANAKYATAELPERIVTDSANETNIRSLDYSQGKNGKIKSLWFLKGRRKTKATKVTSNTKTPITVQWSYVKSKGYSVQLKLTSSDDTVARVSIDSNGGMYLKANNPGDCVITCEDLKSRKKCTLKVCVTIRRIDFARKVLRLQVGQERDIKDYYTTEPEMAASQRMKYTCSNKKIVKVDKSGIITGVKEGTVQITVTSVEDPSIQGMCKVEVVKADPEKQPVYRFFGIANARYQDSNDVRLGCDTDLKYTADAYRAFTRNGVPMGSENIHEFYNCKAVDMRDVFEKMIDTVTDEEDVTVFFYSGHGADDPNNRGALAGIDINTISVEEVKRYFDQIPGTVILLLNSCCSGQFIENKNSMEKAAKAYNKAWSDVFSDTKGGGFSNSHYSKKYKLLTSCSPLESSFGDGTMNFFCRALAAGLGSLRENDQIKGLPADSNKDRQITLNELYEFTSKYVLDYIAERHYRDTFQNVMVWPQNDSFVVYEQTQRSPQS